MVDSPDNEALLQRFPPRLRRNIREVWADGKIGVSGMNISLVPFPNKRRTLDHEEPFSSQFLLKVPYGGRLLEWEVIFNEEDFGFAPDFDFRDEYFLADPNLEIIVNNVPSLAKWDIENPKALIGVLKEFVMFYRKIQINRLQTDISYSKLGEEYRFLIAEIGEENVEVHIDNSESITIAILITIDFSSLPPYVQPTYIENGVESQKILNCGEDTALLKIHFQKPESGRTTTHLQLSPRLEQILGNHSQLHIPPYSRDNRLVDYVNEVMQLLKHRVKDVERHHRLKKEYISALLGLYPGNIVEYDSCKFCKATVLCEVDGHYCLVYISIGNKFPSEKPVVTLRSVCNMNYGKPCNVTLNNYSYSPRWKPEEMVNRLFKELTEVIPKFKDQYNV